MIETLKALFKKENSDVRGKIYYTLIALFIFIVGTTIQVPGTTKEAIIGEGGFIDLLDVMGGGALKNVSILALGVMPYITASIIIQLLQMDVIPTLSDWAKQGDVGRRKLNQITRYLGLGLAFFQGYFYARMFDLRYGVIENGNPVTYITIAIFITAGTAFLLWLGDQITTKGIGNGLSLIIMAGIVSRFPNMFSDAFQTMFDTTSTQSMFVGVLSYAVFVLIYLAIIVGVIFITQAIRKIPIQYANRTHGAYGSQQSFMPIKINSAGVIPVIFASSILLAPMTIAQFIGNATWSVTLDNIFNYQKPVGFVLYLLLIIAFSYIYTFIQLKPEDLADRLQKSGGYIPGIRPGEETEKYISKVLIRLTFVGSLFLAFIAGLPIAFAGLSNLPASVQVGGTSLLIVVGVAIETIKQIEGKLVNRTYKGFITSK